MGCLQSRDEASIIHPAAISQTNGDAEQNPKAVKRYTQTSNLMNTQDRKQPKILIPRKQSKGILYKSFMEFRQRIRQQIEENNQIYKQFFPISELLKFLSELEQRFYEHQASKQLVELIIDFLSFCKNQSGGEPKLITQFTWNFSVDLSMRWQKIREPAYFANKSHLRVLSFIVTTPKSQNSYYEGYFQKFKMDLSLQSCQQLAAIGIQMCREHTGSFAFLTNYLWGSCLNLYNNGVTIEEVEKRYNQILGILCGKYRPAPQIWGKNDQLDIHKLQKQQNLIPKIPIDLKEKPNKDQFLNDSIMERAEEAKQKYDQFYKFMRQVCDKNDGFHFKSNLKIKERSETKALLRIKEKMLKEIYSEYQLQQQMGESKLRFNSKVSLKEMAEEERRKYEQKMKDIYDNLKDPLYFKVSDMLRGKCAFAVVEKINQCCTDIKEALKTEKYRHLKLIEIDNRLRMGTSDLVLKILFGNVIAEMQLVIDLSASDYAFAHKLYELQRSQFFTPLTQLSIMNENLSNSYFTEAKVYIDGNTQRYTQDYEETTTFKEVSQYFEKFVESLPSKIDLNHKFQGCVDLDLMKDQIKYFNKLVKANVQDITIQRSKWATKFIEGVYYLQMNEYQKSKILLKEALLEIKQSEKLLPSDETKKQQIRLVKINILGKLGDAERFTGKYLEALKYYKECLWIQQKMKGKGNIDTTLTLVNMGSVYACQGNYPKALEVYLQSLQIKEKEKGKGSIDTAIQLGNIGLVYKDQGDYSRALEIYQQSLLIQEQVKGKGSIYTTDTLNNMGLIYADQGNYPKALELYQQCLQIKEKVKGKGNIDTASTLMNIGNVYKSQGDYSKALQAFKQSLQIKERVKGKGNIDSASTLGNMGNVFLSLGNYHKALQAYQQALQIKERVKGKGSIDTAIQLGNMGNVYHGQGDYQKALKFYKLSLQIKVKVKGKGCIDTAIQLENIGSVYDDQGDYSQAIQFYEQSLQIKEKIKGKGNIDIASTLMNMGTIYSKQCNFSRGLELFQQSLQITEKVMGKGSLDTAVIIRNIGSSYLNQGNYPKALEAFQQALQIQERVKGKGNIDTALTLNNIGSAYCDQGDYSKALQLYQQSLQILERVKGKGSIDTALTLQNMGSVYSDLGDNSKALEVFQQSLQIEEKVKGKGSISTVSILQNMGIIYFNQEDYPKALQFYQQSLKIEERVKGKGSIGTASTLTSMGNVYRDMGDYQKALQIYQQSLQIKEKTKGNGSIDTASTLENMGIVYQKKRDYSKALQFYQQSLQIKQRIMGKGNIDTATTLYNIGIVYKKSGDYSKASHLYEQSLSIFKKYGRPQANIVAGSLASCYKELKEVGKLQRIKKEYDLSDD